ncbi:MAG: hypothetical protein IPN99_13125 [Bacteroidetes bacterium]|nr:hypothetical protein [Bacteroidota bacterium]
MNRTVTSNISSFLLGFFLSMFLFYEASAQKNIASATLDSVKLKIGDQTNLVLSIETPVQSKVEFPSINDTINAHIEVVAQSKIDTSLSSDKQRVRYTKKLVITSFDSGYFAIAPFIFTVDSDSTNPVYTEALLIQIQTVAVDTTKAIRDIKGPKEVPWNYRELIPYLIGGAVAILILLLLFYFLKKRKVKPQVVVEQKVLIPPHVIALEQLEQLKNEKLWQEGKYKIYQIRLSDIVRSYIENRFQIAAMEQTTDETMRSMRRIHIEDGLRFKLRQLLSLSDMVKFAKEQPLPSENEQSMEDAILFVKTTASTFTEIEGKEDKQ